MFIRENCKIAKEFTHTQKQKHRELRKMAEE